ncbi:MAG: bactofilin family protein, partial [Bryobacteraceae bacterium]
MQPRAVAAEPVRPISTPPPPPAQAAVIGKTMIIKGEVHSQEDLVIDGEVEGKVELNSRLTIGQGGKVNANLKAREVIVHGSVRGNVEAADKIQI